MFVAGQLFSWSLWPWSKLTSRHLLSLAILTLLVASHGALFPARAAAPEGRFQFRSYGAELGLANVAVLQIVQSHDGFIWAGTDDGLYRYDGYRFDGFGLADGLPSTTIEALYEDPAHTLWVGTKSGLAYSQGRRFIALGEAQGLPAVPVNGLAGGREVYVATRAGPYAGAIDVRFKPLPGWPGGEATALLQAKKPDRLYIARWDGQASILAYRDGKFVQWQAPPQAPSERVDALAEDGEGVLWARTANALWMLAPGSAQFEMASAPADLASARGYLATGRRGELYVPTQRTLLRRSGGQWENISQERGLPGGPRPVLEDREGSLWVGSVGLHRLLGRGALQGLARAKACLATWCGRSFATAPPACGLAPTLAWRSGPASVSKRSPARPSTRSAPSWKDVADGFTWPAYRVTTSSSSTRAAARCAFIRCVPTIPSSASSAC